MPRDIQQLSELIEKDLPIAVPALVAGGFASRTTIWRFARDGMPVVRIGRRVFVKFSDLTRASCGTIRASVSTISNTNQEN